MKMVYGPVPSRRLGRSLGVNPIPFKTCNYSCVYCQLGRTTHMTNQRKDFFPPEELLNEIRRVIEAESSHREIDFVTFVGEGEPTLCKSLGWLIRKTKEIADIPIAVDTNGSLLYREDVRNDLSQADIVMPSLDAGTVETYRKINRPHRGLDFKAVVEGLERFRRDYNGEIWVEVMLVKGLNDTERELKALKSRLEKIEPNRTYINVPIRPPAEPWAVPPDKDAITLAHAILNDANVVDITEEETGEFSTEGFTNPEDAILAIIRRHPMREGQVIDTLRNLSFKKKALPKKYNIRDSIKRLEKSGKIKKLKYQEKVFWLTMEEKRGHD
ncbi:radical SAM protein [ANME-1 cluster archaeon AG-394-G21]|nr:radical SAM protein [ANME-1 cluster archaeon AG-394-G21]NAT10130.1 radical SAM protein [ANME-1 cluster archaeon AG-394-G06]